MVSSYPSNNFCSLSGLGTGHGLVEGSTVFGYFRDHAKQDPIILGSAALVFHSLDIKNL